MLSILLATYNGSETIGTLFSKLAEMEHPECPWEVVVVDNGSTDGTPNVARHFENIIPLKLLSYQGRGKNRALNYGLDHIKGDIVLLTDDDIIPDPGWLMNVWKCAFENMEADLFGGSILPLWERTPPSWILETIPLGIAFGMTPDTLCAGPVEPGAIWGANMFVRRKVFDTGLRFNENIGPGAGNYVMGGDTEFMVRAASHGYKTCFCPNVKVMHRIHSKQLKAMWLLKRAYRHGKSIYENNRNKSVRQGMTIGFMKFDFQKGLIRWWIEALFKIILAHFSGDKTLAWNLLWQLFYHSGYMVQATRKISSKIA